MGADRLMQLVAGDGDAFNLAEACLLVAEDAFPMSKITTDAVTRELKRVTPPWPASKIFR